MKLFDLYFDLAIWYPLSPFMFFQLSFTYFDEAFDAFDIDVFFRVYAPGDIL